MLCVLRVVGQEVQHLGDVDRGVRAERDAPARSPPRCCCAQSSIDAVSAPDCDTSASEPGRGQRPGRAGIELQVRALEAQAVGAQQVHAFAPRDALQLGGLLGADAAGDDQRRAAGHAARQLERGGHVRRRQRDDGQVGARLRQVGQRAAGAGVDEVQRAAEALRAQRRAQRPGVARLARRVVGPAGEDDDRLGREQRGEVVFVHG